MATTARDTGDRHRGPSRLRASSTPILLRTVAVGRLRWRGRALDTLLRRRTATWREVQTQ